MIRAALLAAFSAALGGAIALLARRWPALLERTRTFAFAAAAGVVAFHLLPEVLPSQGLAALLWIAAGFALPWALEAGARAFGPRVLQGRGFSGVRVSAEVGFAALVFHSVAEGLALVAALAQPGGKADLEIALVAHHAPLTAAVVLPFLDLRGAKAAALRAGLIGAAGVCGALFSGVVPGFADGAGLQIATAVTAGALLHVVSDEIRIQRFSSRWERAADIGACAGGLLVAGLGAALHMRQQGLGAPFVDFLRAFGGLVVAAAPALLVGAAAVALVPARSRGFRWDAFLLALVLLGPGAAVMLAVFAGALHAMRVPAAPAPQAEVVSAALLQHVRDRGPQLFATVIAAAGVAVSMKWLDGAWPSAAALMVLLALAARLDESGGVVLAAVMVGRGLGAAAAMTMLVSAPLLRRGMMERRLPWILPPAAVLAGELLEKLDAFHLAPLHLAQPLAAQATASPLGAASAAVLVALALATFYVAGARGWFAPLRHGPQADAL
ncbi:MAG TPA: hypothetical protein VLW85_15050 [Myxococcales bacterium]|nr:hypothetical protein [Myxococcales bacterium]